MKILSTDLAKQLSIYHHNLLKKLDALNLGEETTYYNNESNLRKSRAKLLTQEDIDKLNYKPRKSYRSKPGLSIEELNKRLESKNVKLVSEFTHTHNDIVIQCKCNKGLLYTIKPFALDRHKCKCNETAFLYILQNSSKTKSKIGVSTQPERRVKSINSTYNESFKILNQYELPKPIAIIVEKLHTKYYSELNVYQEYKNIVTESEQPNLKVIKPKNGSTEVFNINANQLVYSVENVLRQMNYL